MDSGEILALAGKRLLSCLKKRDLLNSDKAGKSDLTALGERYFQEGRLSDAIDFFEKAEYAQGLTQIREACLAEGDYFLFRRLSGITGKSLSSEELILLGDKALAQGKLLFARSAYLQADHPGKLAQVEKLLSFEAQNQPPDEEMLH